MDWWLRKGRSVRPRPARGSGRERVQLLRGDRGLPVFGVLNRRLALLTAVSGVLITVVISVGAYSFVRAEEIERAGRHARLDISSHLPAIAQSLWSRDSALVQSQLDGFERIPAIARVRLRSAEGVEWTAGEAESNRSSSMSFDVRRESPAREDELGVLDVWLDLEAIEAQSRRLALVPLTMVAGASVMTGVVVLALFHQIIGKHLRHLAGFLERSGSEARGQRFAFRRIDSESSMDELDGIATALNRMLETERALRITEIELMAAMEHSRDGFALFDADDRLMFANREYRRICAVVEDLLVEGTTFETIVRGHVARGAVKQARGSEEEWIRWRMERHRNPLRPFELYFELVGSWIRVKEDKRPGGGILVILCDITQDKQLAQELSRHKHHLEDLVDERTRELESVQQELLRKERLATIGQLTGTVSHELRNPLGTIQSSFSIIRARVGAEVGVVSRACERIERNIERCVSIIDELLEYTRSRELATRPVDVDGWIRSVVDEQDVPRPVVVRTSLRAAIEVPLDAEKLRRAVVNLIQNACQSMLEEGASGSPKALCVSTRAVANGVEITVGDTGPGIAPDLQDKIFEPLFSTRSFGVGLGLSLVKHVVEQHGGAIRVDSAPGAGTRMIIRLPLERGVEGRADGRWTDVASTRGHRPSGAEPGAAAPVNRSVSASTAPASKRDGRL